MKPIEEMSEEELDEFLTNIRLDRRAGIEEKKKRTKAKKQQTAFGQITDEERALVQKFLQSRKG